ncbi:MAG: Glu-tRNA(Gln) amidotransferase subunit GatE, partial [Candidatus Micrarchaeota archaeon]|nr:Glu-tRNA(Gln) amidotransferase subunit GatE [Candidatus Micrarchaeota archaeon]
MRKEVVDGSDPSAFQRSMLIGHDGHIEIDGKKYSITSIFLEEESSGIESSNNETVTYNVDRLGVPLIEVDTAPDIRTPSEARSVALRIGQLLRLTGKRDGDCAKYLVQRGIGSIRQDVNVSIEGGTRVEVKGLQEIGSVDIIIENEVERQMKLLEIKKALLARKAQVGAVQDITKLLSRSGAKMISETLKNGGVVLAAGLPGFAGFIGYEIGANRRLGSEISDYAKMSGVKGIIHSDEDLAKYGFSEGEIESVRKELKLGKDDAFMLVTAQKDMCEKAITLATYRARMAMSEVPPETRAVLDAEKGTTKFMRPLPGGSRMYPETDAKPIVVEHAYRKKILDDTIFAQERIAKIREELGGNLQIADQLIGSPKLQIYEYIASRSKCDKLVVAATLLERMKELERGGLRIDIDDDVMVEIFDKYPEGRLTKAGIVEVIKEMPKSEKEIESVLKKKSLERISGNKLKELIKETGMKGREDVIRAIMSKYRLNVDGEELSIMLGGKNEI